MELHVLKYITDGIGKRSSGVKSVNLNKLGGVKEVFGLTQFELFTYLIGFFNIRAGFMCEVFFHDIKQSGIVELTHRSQAQLYNLEIVTSTYNPDSQYLYLCYENMPLHCERIFG